jgi:hypothetical protein
MGGRTNITPIYIRKFIGALEAMSHTPLMECFPLIPRNSDRHGVQTVRVNVTDVWSDILNDDVSASHTFS